MVGEAILENPAFFTNGYCKETNKKLSVVSWFITLEFVHKQEDICYEYLDLEERYPSQPKEIRKHLFKLLYRAIQGNNEYCNNLASMRLSSSEDKQRLREFIHKLADEMREKNDLWLLENCTLLKSSWYNRYRTYQDYSVLQ